jgi:hypothetical protein
VAPALLTAQTRVNQSAAFRKEPGGTVLGTISAGATVAAGKSQGDWTSVTLEGWVYTPSTGTSARDGFEVAITAAGGENLRGTPNGAVIGRLANGALLDRVGTQGKWTHVRRSGWMSAKALTGPATATRPATKAPGTNSAPRDSAPETTDSIADRVQATRATALTLEPDGAALATLAPGTSGQVIGRSGEWVQVQLQGWVREADLSEPASAAIPGVTVAQVRANPGKYIGQLLEWKVQFISIQTADELRPEIPNGSKYLLTRGPLPEPGFVYVVVTAQQLPTFQSASPLQEFTMRGRLRAAQTRYLPTPVLDLVQVVDSTGGTR